MQHLTMCSLLLELLLNCETSVVDVSAKMQFCTRHLSTSVGYPSSFYCLFHSPIFHHIVCSVIVRSIILTAHNLTLGLEVNGQKTKIHLATLLTFVSFCRL